jgi:hypothetical protein
VSALASGPVEQAAPAQGPTGSPRERLRLVSPPLPQLTGSSLPQRLLDTWDSALAATERALEAARPIKVYNADEFLCRRHWLREERRWLLRLVEIGVYDSLPQFLMIRNCPQG